MKKDSAIRVSAPSSLLDKAAELAEGADTEDTLIDGMKTFFEPAGVTIGPAFHAYASYDMIPQPRWMSVCGRSVARTLQS